MSDFTACSWNKSTHNQQIFLNRVTLTVFTALIIFVCVVLEFPLDNSMEELSPVVKKRLNSRKYHDTREN